MASVDWKLIDKALDEGDYASVFGELSNILDGLPPFKRPVFHGLKSEFEQGFANVQFNGRLRAFLQDRDLRQKFPQTEPSAVDASANNATSNNNNKPKEEEKKGGIETVLMLTANPAGTTELKLHEERSQIQSQIQEQDVFDVVAYFAIDKTGLMDKTLDAQPQIIHFSGHGTNGATEGLMLQNDQKNGYDILTTEQVDVLFEFFASTFPIQAVILNACYSKNQAEVIQKYVPFVVGTTKAIGDTHAIGFSVGFYMQLAKDPQNIKKAFEAGRTRAVLAGAKKADFELLEKQSA